jgi:arylformamidase
MGIRKIYDISHSLRTGFPGWPGDSPGLITQTHSLANGESYNSSWINASLHWGTHIDAPSHLFSDKLTIDKMPPDLLVGSVKVIHFPQIREISSKHLERYDLTNTDRIIFKTRNSEFWDENPLEFRKDFTALTSDAAQLLVESKVRLVGIDYFSLDLFHEEKLPVHKILYRSDIFGIEGLDLREVAAGDYELVCLPIKIWRGDGAPARVILIET